MRQALNSYQSILGKVLVEVEETAYEEYKTRWWHKLGRQKKVLAILTISASIFGLGFAFYKIRLYLEHIPKDREKLAEVVTDTLKTYQTVSGDDLEVSLVGGGLTTEGEVSSGVVIEFEARGPRRLSRSVFGTIQNLRQVVEIGLRRARLQ